MTQTEFVRTGAGESKNAIVLRMLEGRAGEWVSLGELVSAGGGYAIHSRVADLRKAGHAIENQVCKDGGWTVSRYRYNGRVGVVVAGEKLKIAGCEG